MKVKTSITLSAEIIQEVDRFTQASGNRSEFIEAALKEFIARKTRDEQNRRDLGIINRKHARLNREAEDVMAFQSDS
jgi:metal-responsive CopG/Arc/MetJ family transcriptional regulator